MKARKFILVLSVVSGLIVFGDTQLGFCQATSKLSEVLSLKSECAISFEGERIENENSDLITHVKQLKKLMNLKAKEFYYHEREKEIQQQKFSVVTSSIKSSEFSQSEVSETAPLLAFAEIATANAPSAPIEPVNTNQCLSCFDEQIDQDHSQPGPAGCTCYLCQDCAPGYCDMVVNRDGEDLNQCPGCKNVLHTGYLAQQGRSKF